jgi:hypothetical protein
VPASDKILVTDGSLDWSLGCNSIKTPTIVSQLNPTGMARNELSWMDNCTVRSGGITQRPGWLRNGALPGLDYYGGSFVYRPDGGGTPYLITVMGGHVWRVDPDDPASATDLSAAFSKPLPITERCFFCQAERWLIIQAGDGITLPLFWDGTTLSQSIGIVDPLATPATGPHVNELPAATAMCYYMGRVWYAQNRTVSAGDIVGGASAYPAPGPPYYGLKDSVLCVQENPLCVGGDGFTVPTHAGNIRGLSYAANINTMLGQGNLYIGTTEEIYQLQVPVTRGDWINASAQNQPLMTVAVAGAGWVSDRSIVQANSDLFFQTIEPAIRSLALAIRNFGQWGNVPLSINEYRMVQFNDRRYLRFASGVLFDNRVLQTALPYDCGYGIAHKALAPLNFDVISSLSGQVSASAGVLSSYPAWEGMWEGLNILEILSGDFGGLQRALMLVWSDANQAIEVWEVSHDGRYDKEANRVVWYVEFPAFTFGAELDLKRMVSGEVWIDRLWGEAILKIEWRPDGYVCWVPWHQWTVCCESDEVPTPQYPEGINRQSYKQMISLPVPPADVSAPSGRPSNQGYQFQIRLTVKGYCRLRGLFLHAEKMGRRLYADMATG